jgi:hypothetical protein
MFAAVPVAYPGDRIPVKAAAKKTAARVSTKKTASARKPAAKSATSASGKAVRTAGKRTSGA